MSRFRASVAVCVVVVAAGRFAGAVEPLLDPAGAYVAERLNAVTYDVDYSVVVTSPYKTKLLQVWVPVPPSNFGQERSEIEWSTFPNDMTPQIVAEPTFGNCFAYFEFAAPQGAQVIRQQLRVKVWELRWRLDPNKVTPVAEWPASFEPYRRSESQAVVIAAHHRELLSSLFPTRSNPFEELASVMAYAREQFRYDHTTASLAADSEHALRTGGGHCSDYHGFCAALGRALGYPTRITYGLNTFPKASPSHCKLEAYLPPYSWVSFDVSETQKLTAAIATDTSLADDAKQRLTRAAVERLRSGFRDNTWYLQTVGSDYDLVPAASRRVPVVRTIYAEADGVPLPDPDPSDPTEKTFAWMTTAKFTADRPTTYPFADVKSLVNAQE